jgi:type VI secretion system protein VasJ
LSALIIDPISGATPAGNDARYDDAYLLIEAEIDKAGSMSEGAVTDWRVVRDESERLLSQQSKDLKLAVWWTFGCFKLSGFEGLADALQALDALLGDFAETLFPRSPKGRLNALTWLETVLEAALLTERGHAIPLPQAEPFLERFRALQGHLKPLCGADQGLFRELCRRLETSVAETKRREEAQAPKQSTAASPGAVPAFPEEITSDADAAKLLNQLKKSAGLLSSYWRGREMDDRRAMRLVRMVGWLETEGVPEAKNGKTMLNPPSVERVEKIKTLMETGEYGEALELVESMLFRSPFWLEGQRLAFNILEAAGKTETAAELRHMVAGFVNAHDGVTACAFRDATPFAPAAVGEWLNGAAADGTAAAPATAEGQGNRYELLGQECYALLRKKQTKEAMQMLHAAHAAAASGEERFRWRLLHAEVAVEAGKPQMALALIGELEQEVERYRLDAWRPDLAARVYTLLLNSFNRTQLEREKRDAAYQRLCRVDTAGAVDIKLH